MAGKGFVNLEMFQFAENVVKTAKLNVGVSKKGRRIEASGDLRKSIRYNIRDNGSIEFFMEDYGVYVDSGRDGVQKKYRNKKGLISKSNAPAYPNVGKIQQWMDDKPIRIRSLKTNQFIKRTERSIEQTSFLISRKIFEKGIKPTYFFSDALRKFSDDFADDLLEGVWNDYKLILKNI